MCFIAHPLPFLTPPVDRPEMLRLSASPLRVFPTVPHLSHRRASLFSLVLPPTPLVRLPLQSQPPSFPFAILMSLFCWPFCPARIRVFLARHLPLPDPFILPPPSYPDPTTFRSPTVFRHFSLFLYPFPRGPPPPSVLSPPSLSFGLSFSSFILALCFFAKLARSFSFPSSLPYLCPLSLSPVLRLSLSSLTRVFPLSSVFILTFNDNGNYVVYRVHAWGVALPRVQLRFN